MSFGPMTNIWALLKLFTPANRLFQRKSRLKHVAVPLAQRIARWTSNPKVLGSIPRWDVYFPQLEAFSCRARFLLHKKYK